MGALESAIGNWLRCRWPRSGDKGYLDEMLLTINDEGYYLWRAVDQEDHILDILVQRRHNKTAEKKFFKHLFKGWQYVSRGAIRISCRAFGMLIRPAGARGGMKQSCQVQAFRVLAGAVWPLPLPPTAFLPLRLTRNIA